MGTSEREASHYLTVTVERYSSLNLLEALSMLFSCALLSRGFLYRRSPPPDFIDSLAIFDLFGVPISY